MPVWPLLNSLSRESNGPSLFFSEPFAVKHSMRVVSLFSRIKIIVIRNRHSSQILLCVEVFALLLRVSAVVVVVWTLAYKVLAFGSNSWTTTGFLGVDFIGLVLFSVAAFHAVTSFYFEICAYFVKLERFRTRCGLVELFNCIVDAVED